MKRHILIALLCLSPVLGQAASTVLAITPTGDTIEDKRIVLSNSQAARTWSTALGTNWTKVRLAMRIIMTNTAANLTGTPVFAAGICAGTNNVFQHSVCSNFVGIASTGATWTFSAGPPARYSGMTMLSATKVGNSQTNFGSFGSLIFTADSSTTNRALLFIDITKGASTNFTVGGFLRTGTASLDVSYNDFLLQAESAAPSMAQHAAASSPQVPVNEPGNGYLDSVCIAWGRTTPTILVSDVYVVKLQ